MDISTLTRGIRRIRESQIEPIAMHGYSFSPQIATLVKDDGGSGSVSGSFTSQGRSHPAKLSWNSRGNVTAELPEDNLYPENDEDFVEELFQEVARRMQQTSV
jgi:hypothetical protein